MKKLFILLALSLINLNTLVGPVLAGSCNNLININWNMWENKGYASFTFKSSSSSTIKIYDLILKTDSGATVAEYGKDFYIAPFNVVDKKIYIGNLNKDVIKSSSYLCVQEEKKTGTGYISSAKWKKNSKMAYNDCGITGFICDAWLGVSVDHNNFASKGSKLTVYNKNGGKIETFVVRTIHIDYDIGQCWLSKEDKKKYKDYLSISNCSSY